MKAEELIIKELIKRRAGTQADLNTAKRKISKRYKVSCPSNINLLKIYHKLLKDKRIKKSETIERILRTRPVRSLSGIVNVSVLTKPYPCPGKCVYCPDQKGTPKSYLNNEPAVMRAVLNKYDPGKQVKMRLRALKSTGHPTEKVELRIIGGTWSFYPKNYQLWFIKRCFEACNKKKGKALEKVQILNEKSKHRIVGLSVETRPDFITKEEIKRMRILGITKVELGVQSIYDKVLKLNKRGHGVKETIEATKLLKDTGFKICYQIIPNLPGSTEKMDREMFKELFRNENFQPDFLKIYPCALLKEAPLYKWWKEKRYKPYKDSQLINLVKSIKKTVPHYVRIERITRDIPSPSVVAGPGKISNLRQILKNLSEKEGWQCKCIRCREIRENINKEKLYLFRINYKASGGKEIFLSFEDKNRKNLYSLLRLRIPSQFSFIKTLREAAIIREIHTYGQQLPVKESSSVISPQHKGLGKKLIKEAEKIAKKEFGLKKIAVISSVGTRNYYRKLGYKLENTYMVKEKVF
ncbi:MAG: tRNA uridine(34) 5-carboxymethylaminomethyl modification radical SAM/GNAT enzyme Elp3 [Candidatus Nealsonbacteria bacterium]